MQVKVPVHESSLVCVHARGTCLCLFMTMCVHVSSCIHPSLCVSAPRGCVNKLAHGSSCISMNTQQMARVRVSVTLSPRVPV